MGAGCGGEGAHFSKFHLILVKPRRPLLRSLRNLNTSFVCSPFTSDFFISGNDTPWLSWQNEALDTRPVSATLIRRRRGEVDVHLFVLAWLLPTELVAWEANDHQAAVFILCEVR